MKTLVKIPNSEISYRLNLNYNNVYSRLRMILGNKASLFADISTKSTGTSWYSDDDAEYSRLSEAPKSEINRITAALNDYINSVRKDLSTAPELNNYTDDILEIPDNSFVFYRTTVTGYKFILAGWGCKFAHQSPNDPNAGFIKRISKNIETPDSRPVKEQPPKSAHPQKSGNNETFVDINVANDKKSLDDTADNGVDNKIMDSSIRETDSEKDEIVDHNTNTVNHGDTQKSDSFSKKTQHIIVKVYDQNRNPVVGEIVNIRTLNGESQAATSDTGEVEIGQLPYGDNFGISFPDIQGNQERGFEVEPNIEVYETYVKKLHRYSPLLFIEDQDGNAVMDYNVKIVINGKESVYNSGYDGVIQLPSLQEGQKFIVIDTANYANTEEFNVTQTDAKTPYRFHIKYAEKTKVGITVLDKSGTPIPNAIIDLAIGEVRCNQTTGKDGRAEFPYDVFKTGYIPVELNIKGKGKIKSELNFSTDIIEYTIQLQGKKVKHNWKWLALLPLLFLLAWGGYKLYNLLPWGITPIDEMKTGVVLVQSECVYYVDLGLTQSDGKPQRFYFAYSPNENKFYNGTFNETEAPIMRGTGTGFLVSKDGLIATNRHIADPVPPEGASTLVKRLILIDKERFEETNDSLNDILRTIGPLRMMDPQYKTMYDQSLKQQQMVQKYIQICDKILTIGNFKVKVECRTSVAFLNSIIETWDDFVGCSLKASGEPGGVSENDVAIIQLKNKERDVPKDTYIFTVPEKDLMDEDIPDDYEISVLGYNAGVQLADITNGITPQVQPGKITMKNEKYRIGYNASTMGGSSGSPVINKKHQLVAVNNSGVADTQGFNYGVRTKYLKELLDEVQGKSTK